MTQADRYNALCALTGKDFLGYTYQAAFYLLSYDIELYEIAYDNVSSRGVDFTKIKCATEDFDEQTRFVVDIAHNLFSYNRACKSTPFEISRLSYPNLELVCNALHIAAGQTKVIIRTDENQKPSMELDTTPQANLYNALCALTKKDFLGSDYQAAFYLLSDDLTLYEIAHDYNNVFPSGIDFPEIKHGLECLGGWDTQTRFVLDIAHNLFSHNSPCQATPFEISRLSYPNLELVCNALHIAAGQTKVIIHTDENQKLSMELDTSPCQKTKSIHDFLEQMQKPLVAEQGALSLDDEELEP